MTAPHRVYVLIGLDVPEAPTDHRELDLARMTASLVQIGITERDIGGVALGGFGPATGLINALHRELPQIELRAQLVRKTIDRLDPNHPDTFVLAEIVRLTKYLLDFTDRKLSQIGDPRKRDDIHS